MLWGQNSNSNNKEQRSCNDKLTCLEARKAYH